MAWFNNLKLSIKITILILVALIGITSVATILNNDIGSIYKNTEQITNVRLPGTDLILQIDRDMQQALVAERSLFFAQPGTKKFNDLKKDQNDNIRQAFERWEKYKALPKVEKEKTLLPLYDASYQEWKEKSTEITALLESGRNRERAVELSFGEANASFEKARDVIDQLTEAVEEVSQQEFLSAETSRDEASRNMWIISFIAFWGTGIIGFLVIRAVANPVKEVAVKMLNADLNFRFHSNRFDEIGDLQRAFNSFVDQIKNALLQVTETSAAVASASTEISSSTEELAAGAHEQSSQAGEVAAAIEEMTKTLTATLDNIRNVESGAHEAKEAALKGGEIVTQTVSRMKSISDVVNQSASQVKILGESSKQIGEIIDVIDEIADQTNLLALNAAIEAARAGDQGRGFAVVADEVRKLAERTSKATKEIASMIRQIQTDTTQAVSSMEKGTEEVEAGITLAGKAGTMLENIVSNSLTVAGMIESVAAASAQQASASEEISKHVEGISVVTQESASGTQQIARSAEDLNRLTEGLQQLLAQFQLNGEARTAKPVHRTATAEKNGVKAYSSQPEIQYETN
ncbi:MAG: methyl-accepting chemotaxis protein [Bacteroidetes bacterium]|nr:methyl-accepting chemotaxis protein [Bacteroidota bacterium]